MQPNIPTTDVLKIDFISDIEKCEALASCFNVQLEREGINKLIKSDELINEAISKLRIHLSILKEKDDFLHSLFNLAVNTIFCGESEHAVGGTTSAAIGIVWGNPSINWQVCDYLEYFLHELTHTLMFLDELRFLHYKNMEFMYQKENFSLSAILQAERPIDRVLHSIVVATEILLFRLRELVDDTECQIHPKTNQLIESTELSIERLLTHPNRDEILTERSLNIIEICRDHVAKHANFAY